MGQGGEAGGGRASDDGGGRASDDGGGSRAASDQQPLRGWSNWSGSLRFDPDDVAKPGSEEELCELVARCADEGRHVRVVGSGHSATGILETEDQLVNLERMTGLVSHDRWAREATVRAGTTLEEAGNELVEVGLEMHNYGDVSTQMVAGAIGTGTHGTGPDLRNLSAMLVGGRMVTSDGDVIEFDAEDDPELIRAARVALGTLGIFTEIRLDLQPAHKLTRREYCTNWRAVDERIETLVEENRNFDFYWYPRSDEVKLRLLNPPGSGTDHEELTGYATLVEERTGWANQVIPKHSHIPRRFDEMEYAVPADAGLECFREVRDRVRERWRSDVGWRLLWRTIAADDSFLSTAYGRDTVSISLHQNSELPHQDYFRDVEPIFREYDGRPHWAKKHTMRAPELRELYPEWDRFQSIRLELDPEGVFMSDYLYDLLGDDDERQADGAEVRRSSDTGEESRR